MSQYRTLFLALAGAAAAFAATPSAASALDRPMVEAAAPQQARDQDRAYSATRRGDSMPLPMIERRVMPFMGGADYLGPEFDGDTYRLKFMRDGRVIWVDVEAATGRILGTSRRGRR